MSLRKTLTALWWTQFCGAFNDNLYKNALIIIFTFQAESWGLQEGAWWVNIIAALFITPFVLFSLMAGRLADRLIKTRLIRLLKGLEVGLMLLGSLAILQHSLWGILCIIFLLGVHSAFFGPVKYAVLPELVGKHNLALANGWVELGTFLAIILGTNLSALLIPLGNRGIYCLILAVIFMALLGLWASLKITSTQVCDQSVSISANPFQGLLTHLAIVRQGAGLWAAMVGNSWFWFFGAIYLTELPNYCKEVLSGSSYLVTLFWTLLSLSVAAGSLLSGRLLSTRLSRLLIAASLIAMSVLSLCLSVIDTLPSSNRVIYALLEVVGLGFFAGMYIVPMYVWIQQHTPLHHRAAVLGLTNMFNALFMIAASLLILVGLSQGLTISRMFGVLGYLNAMFLVLMLIGAPSLVSQQHSRQS